MPSEVSRFVGYRTSQQRVVSPQRSPGRSARPAAGAATPRVEIRVIQQVAVMAGEGVAMPAIRRIIELGQRLAEVARQRDELAARLFEVSNERSRLS